MTVIPESAAPATDTGSLAPTLPGRCYTEQAVFDLEQQRIFGTEWVYVAHAGELPASGDVVRRPVGSETVIVVRGRDGRLRAFLNVCRHRGAQLCLTDTQSVGRAIRCPYHAWSYGLDGKLIAAPNMVSMPDLDKSRYGLVPVALAEWEGLVWVNLDPDAPPLTDHLVPQLEYRLGVDASRLDRYRIGELVVGFRREYDVAANWKIIQENFQECYHCGTIHPELIEQIPTFSSFEELGDGAYYQGGYAFGEGREAFSLSGRSEHQTIPGVQSESRVYFGMVLRPNCFVSLLPDHVIVHRFEPVSPARTKVVCEWLFTRDTVEAPGFDPADTVELFHRVNEQDFAASEWCQPNMSSRAYRDGGALVPLESTIIGQWYYPWYRSKMGIA
jgi:Rieske 2Fe-2S family protein